MMESTTARDGYETAETPLDVFTREYGAMEQSPGMFTVSDALIKHPGRTTFEITEGHKGRVCTILLLVTLACVLGYGVIMGSFAGGPQLWHVPLKLTLGLLLSALVCLPSLYILTSLAGSSRSLLQTSGYLLQTVALMAMLLAGFGPIAWVFSQATATTPFMGLLHVAFWWISAAFSMELLKRVFRHAACPCNRVLDMWALVFLCVLLQMSTTLRPLVGRDDEPGAKPKLFFVTHWFHCMENPLP